MSEAETRTISNPWVEYMQDAMERSVLFMDVLRQRGNNYEERIRSVAPNVLTFDAELVADGRTFERPVNCDLVRIEPPKGTPIDPKKRPFIVFDPRAGHGPGIGGMKHDSEIGVAMNAGHPCSISSASCPSRCRARPSRMSVAPRRSSCASSPNCTPGPRASRR